MADHKPEKDEVTFDVLPFTNPCLLESGREKFKLMGLTKAQGIYLSNLVIREEEGPADMQGVLQTIKDAEVFPDDVITVGFPRNGNRWVYYTAHMVMSQKLEFVETEFLFRLIEGSHDVISLLKSIPRPRLFVSHLPLTLMPDQTVTRKPRVVYVLRNPKDAIVSWYRQLRKMKDPTARFTGSWAEFFELMLTGDMTWGSWFDHVLRSEKFMKDHPEVPIFVLQYETYKENPTKVVAELCRFLGQSESKAQDIARETEMENMRRSLLETLSKLEKKFCDEVGVLHKKGIIGDWKNHFTVEQNERFNRLFDAKMAGSELADRVRPYM